MKRALVILLFIITVVTLVTGKVHWEQKIKMAKADDRMNHSLPSEVEKEKEVVAEAPAQKVEPVTQPVAQTTIPGESKEEIIKYTKNLPKNLQEKFLTAAEQGQSLQMAILGSASTSAADGAWPTLLKKQLTDTYGESLLHVSIKEIYRKTSADVVKERLYQDMLNTKVDILLIEPFLLHDNGRLFMPKRLENLTTILNDFKKANPEIVIMIQPSNPIYLAHYYVKEEQQLEEYAKNNQYIYLNHWEVWPDGKSKDLKQYLTDKSLPNQKGNELWADYLTKYFVHKE
ncbi:MULTISPECIES: hypothetical protein [unclassified Bacillus (in: firmicutes)]|uniref:SGNH/GDSL hydrolase family protein n=1 Tax=unclassified Bacillus (in: firmicutes) TaxID=185979 RepID=UPI0008EAB9EE|nr:MULTISPECIES: hypothetical protein [unclassified Bacillus (in: firmicutes)]SFB19854.1 hypothetical protein SAMN02799634_10840 [Bacillus sp. UNCCL13]SFQ90766.1 hypothetical protein SAMN04488577_3856 [Bacillus sp. cl95]